MNILFIHPNMPGQYKHLAQALGATGAHNIVFITKHKTAEIPGVKRITYGTRREPSPHSHRYLIGTERAVLQGQEVWRVCKQLRGDGFVPDIICAHPGWGDALFIKDIFPESRTLFFFEFYYRSHGADVNFDLSDTLTHDDFARLRMKNITNQTSLDIADWGVCPTAWQYSVHPDAYKPKLSVLHDGVDVTCAAPNAAASFTTPSGKTFKPGDEVVTYIARNFEPYRGFPTFMKTAEILLRERPNLHIIAVGADSVSYGKAAPKGTTYREMLQKQVTLDTSRIHFVGTVPYDQLMALFQITRAHIYLTYPFVLSWSMLEAMACGAPLVASRTKPVEEVITHEQHGLLADFFSPQDVAQQVMRLLEDAALRAHLAHQGRAQVVQYYDLTKVLPLQLQLIDQVAKRQLPPPVANDITAFYPLENYVKAMWHGE